MIHRIIITTLAIASLTAGVSTAGITVVDSDSTLNPSEGCYGAPAEIYAQTDDDPEQGSPDPPYFDSQFPGPDGPPGPGPRHLERLRLKKLLQLLDLDKDQRDRFVQLFREMRTGMIKNRQQTKQLVDRLAKGLRSGNASDDEIQKLVTELDELEARQFEHMRTTHAEIKRILTPRQLGKFYVFRERFEKRIMEHLGRRGKGRFPGAPWGSPDQQPDSTDSMKR